MPKTAGTSFSTVLRSRFAGSYRADYDDKPMQVSSLRRRGHALLQALRMRRDGVADRIECVHGHFLPAKYRLGTCGRELRYVTWLRDPVERVVSHYHYWRRGYDRNDPTQPLRTRMHAEHWSLERFALGPEMRNLYGQYLWGFDPAHFDFIGITEHYAEDLDRLARRHLGCQAVEACELVNPERGYGPYPISAGLRRRIEQHHAADVALYRWAVGSRSRLGQ